MQKVTDILEKNVEWIAIGLGALFMLFMTWSYVLTPVASVEINQQNLGPGEVDEFTLTNVGKELESRMNENVKLATTVPSYVGAFKATMNWGNAPVISMAGVFADMTLDPVPPPMAVADPRAPAPPGVAAPRLPKDHAKVTQLPVPPPAEPADYKFGRSVVQLPGPDGQMPPAPQPGEEVQGGEDKDWITHSFKVDMDALAAEFRKTNIPIPLANQEAFLTAFLSVEMQREELDENGQPIAGSTTTMQAIPLYRGGQPPPPFPAEDAPKEEQLNYLTWAATNSGDIIQPLFYTTVKGDMWTKPGAPLVVAEFDPSTFRGDLNSLPPEQRKAVLDYNREQSRLREEQRRQSRPAARPPAAPGRDGGGFIPPGINYAPAPPRQPARPPANLPPGRGAYGPVPQDIGGPGLGMGPEGGMYPGGYPGGGPAGATPVNLPQPGVDYPNTQFDPAKWAGKQIEVWAHDDNVEPEKTYRYRLKYKIKNPIWAIGNVANPDELSDVFALESPWSAWSSPVTIPPLVNFFVLNPPFNGTTCRFEVFRWEKGEPRSETFTVTFGDEIGGMRNGLDYSTGWSVVDFRPDPRPGGDMQVILVNSRGKLVSRGHRADQSDTLYRSLKEQIANAKATETAAANGGAAATGK